MSLHIGPVTVTLDPLLVLVLALSFLDLARKLTRTRSAELKFAEDDELRNF